jgi:LCP family protein required for cell wall assembly
MKFIDSANKTVRSDGLQKPVIRPQVTSQNHTPKKPEVVSLLKTQKKSKKWVLKSVLVIILILILSLGGVVLARTASLSDKIFVGQKMSFFQKIKDVIRGGSHEVLIGENIGQVNILLLGIGGEGHEGPYLSDTMIIAQIRPQDQVVSLTSIPRDLLVSLPNNMGERKINSAFAEGFNKNKSFKEAGEWAINVAEKVSGLKIPYFAVIDFNGFEKAIDKVNGITLEVERTFTDSQYPDNNFGYLAPLTFQKGTQTMNGKTALQFARSRHGNNGEGSDFARSQRQQKVISAFKQKVLDLNLIKDVSTINNLVGVFADHFHTNISPGESFRLLNLIKEKNIQNFLSTSLDQETSLICSKILESNGAWVLLPCPGKTEKDIQNFFKNSFVSGKIRQEKAVVWLAVSNQNSENQYQNTDKLLKEAGMTVWEVGSSTENLTNTIVYPVNSKPATLEFIKNSLSATEVTLPPPGIKIDPLKVDLVVILGEN